MSRSARWFFGSLGSIFLCFAMPTAASAAPCVGDCYGNGSVSVADLIIGVNIALGYRDVTDCLSFDVDGDSMVRVNELIRGVRSALDGCEAVETPTSGVTETPTGTPPTGDTATPTSMPTETPGTPVGTATATLPPSETPTGAATVSATVTPAITATPAGTATTVIPPTETPTGVATVSATVTPAITGTPVGTATTVIPPTETPTPTSTGEPAPATQTPIIETVASGSVVVGNALGGIANVIAAAVTGITGGAGGGVLLGVGEISLCELGGMVEAVGTLPADVSLTLTDCAVSRPNGSAVFNGTIALTDVGIVSLIPPRLSAQATFVATIVFKDESDVTTLTTDADLSAEVEIAAAAATGQSCAFELPAIGDARLTGLDLVLNGTIESSSAAGSAKLEFDDTKGEFSIEDYGTDCVPSQYTLKLNGAATASHDFPAVVLGGGGGPFTFALDFVDFVLAAKSDGDVTEYELDGSVAAECFGGSVSLETVQSLELALGQICPTSGQLSVAGVGTITYEDGAVSVDDLDPETAPRLYESCLDPSLLVCSL